MKRIAFGMIAALLGFGLTGPAAAQSTNAVVTTAADGGPGSLRAALASGASRILFTRSVGTIALQSPLTWSGTSLVLVGSGQVIDGGGTVGTLLTLTGTQVDVSRLTLSNTLGSGLHVVVPASATGIAQVDLRQVGVESTGLHGVHVDDLSGAASSVALRTTDVTVDGAGTGESDQDGVRVDERGEGNIGFTSRNSAFQDSGADGVELDEGGNGDVLLDVVSTRFRDNGPLDPTDLDDGIDVDEADTGSVRGRFAQSEFVGNYDEGIDLNETASGDLVISLTSVTVVDTVDGDGLQIDEEDAGNVDELVLGSTLVDNDGDDIDLEQDDAGTGTFRLRGSTVGSVNLNGVTQV